MISAIVFNIIVTRVILTRARTATTRCRCRVAIFRRRSSRRRSELRQMCCIIGKTILIIGSTG